MGVVQDHNTEHPDQKVECGDYLLVINGKWGNSMELLNELMYAPTLEILVEKSCPNWLGKPLPVEIAPKDIMPGPNMAPKAEVAAMVVKHDPVVNTDCAMVSFGTVVAAMSLKNIEDVGSED